MSGITFDRVSFGYRKGKPIFNDLTLEIAENKLTVLLGANGSGKSTFLKLCLGFLKPSTGSIIINNRNLTDWTITKIGHQFSYIAQSPSLPYHLSVRDYILLGRSPHLNRLDSPSEEDHLLCNKILSELELEHLSSHSLQEISGGEQQLASFGRILAQDSPIILADEMASDLDIKNTFKIIQLLNRLKKDHTILFSTHDPHLAEAIADQVILFQSGEEILAGNPEDLLTQTQLSKLYDIPEEFIENNPVRILWKK